MEKAFIKPYEQGWASKPAENSWVTPQIMDNYDQAINEIDNRVIGINEDLTQFSNDGYVGFNCFDKLEQGTINSETGELIDAPSRCRSKDFVLVKQAEYPINVPSTDTYIIIEYKNDKTFLSSNSARWSTNDGSIFNYRPSANAKYFKIVIRKNSNVNVIPSDFADCKMMNIPSNIELKENLTQLNIATTKAITTNVTSAYGSIGYASFTQIGNTKKIYAEINVTSQLSAWGVVCTLPTEARPSATQTLSISVGANRYRGFLNTDGTITTSSPITSGQTVVLESIYI